MKLCTMCFLEKPYNCFNKKRDYLSSYCKDCNIENLKKHYIENKNKYKDRNLNRKNKINEFIRSQKEWKSCMDCGWIFHYSAMDFDHLRDKNFHISKSSALWFSIEKIKEEIDKCELVCSNCHRVRTFNRQNNCGSTP